jgi:hypothetical protein
MAKLLCDPVPGNLRQLRHNGHHLPVFKTLIMPRFKEKFKENILPLLPPAAKNLFVKRFLDFQKLFTDVVEADSFLDILPHRRAEIFTSDPTNSCCG